MEKARNLPAGHYKLLLPFSMIDDYQQHLKTFHKKMHAIYLSLANFSTKDLRSKDFRFLVAVVPRLGVQICVVPETADLFEVIRTVLVEPLRCLERGVTFELENIGKQAYIGSLFALLGDHKGQAEIAGITSALSDHPCRFSLVLKENIPFTHDVRAEDLRSPWKSYEALKKYVTKDVKKKYKMNPKYRHSYLNHELGLLPTISPLWDLVWFRFDFFQRFGICLLHLEPEGNWQYHTKYIGAKMGAEFRELVHSRLRSTASYPGIEKPNA